MKTSGLATALKSMIEGLNDGVMPVHKHLFDHVWIGMPEKIPMGDRRVAIIDVLGEPEFHYTNCQANTQFDVDVRINIMCKGHVENATLDAYDMIDAIKEAMYTDDSISGGCIFSNIINVDYGTVAGDPKNIVIGGYIDIKCRMY
jgi:hypothetical protein